MRFRSSNLLIPLQAFAAIIAFATLTIWPPVSGAMLLVPLPSGDTYAAAKAALGSGAVLLGAGPFPGSLVVIGDRSRIARSSPWNFLILAAPAAGCSARAPREAAA